MESNEFIQTRAQATSAAQISIANIWVWSERTLPQWNVDLAAFRTQHEMTANAEALKDARVGVFDAALDVLHDHTQVALNLFKTKNRNDPAKVHALRALTAIGGSRSRIMDEALSWESAWEELEPDWEPIAGQTLASFKLERKLCETLSKEYSDAKAAWRREVGKWNALGEILNDACVAWYAAATQVFKESTPEGAMIRGTIPTTYQPLDFPEKAAITLAESPEHNRVVIEFEARNATGFNLLHKGPSEAQFTKLAEDVKENSFDHAGLSVGVHQYKVIGKNSRGAGPESDIATVTVA
jgi:hypothetical protein